MKKSRWRILSLKDVVPDDGAYFVSQYIQGVNGVQTDVTIGRPGWSWYSRGVYAIMKCPPHFIKDRDLWYSQYNGDDFPDEKCACLVSTFNEKTDRRHKQRKVIDSYWVPDKDIFLRLEEGDEVIAWLPYPKPYPYDKFKS
jgi:hypothetical protein